VLGELLLPVDFLRAVHFGVSSGSLRYCLSAALWQLPSLDKKIFCSVGAAVVAIKPRESILVGVQ
jgi:hypothetical protein